MRLFEILIMSTLFITLVVRLVPMEKRVYWTHFLPGTTVLFVLFHLVIEKYRWQMVPAYILAGFLLLLSIIQIKRQTAVYLPKGRHFINILGTSLCLLILAVASVISILIPVFKLPQPSGPYAVGSTFYHFIDTDREEILTAIPDDKRELLVQVWYPANPSFNENRAPYWENAHTYSSLLAGTLGLPSFLFDHLSLVKTHTYPEALIATDEPDYPVLIFSPGYTPGIVSQNTAQMEELASHGYIIFSIAHTYETLAVIYPDGEVIPFSNERLAAIDDEDASEVIDLLYEQIEASTDTTTRDNLFRKMVEKSPLSNESINIWAEDTIFVMDELEHLNLGDNRFAGKLDLARIGVFGMSFGGAAAGQVCLLDDRCQAALNMDGAQYGDFIDDVVLERPFMMMYSEDNYGMNVGMNDFMLDSITGTTYRIIVAGSMHSNFSDYTFISPLFQLFDLLGPIDGFYMAEITSAYTLAFFDKHLRGKESPLLSGPSSPYPEVSIEIRNL